MKKTVLTIFMFMILASSYCRKHELQTPVEEPVAGELIVEDIQNGTGKELMAGNRISAHYTGWLVNGKKFDSSYDRGNPMEVTIGIGKVIKGWDQGLTGMKEGGVRKLTIPPHLAYGRRNVGNLIPANSTLVFEVKLLQILD